MLTTEGRTVYSVATDLLPNGPISDWKRSYVFSSHEEVMLSCRYQTDLLKPKMLNSKDTSKHTSFWLYIHTYSWEALRCQNDTYIHTILPDGMVHTYGHHRNPAPREATTAYFLRARELQVL